MNSFLLMIAFFTRIKIPRKFEYSEVEYKKGIKLLPLVGAVIGFLLYAFSALLHAIRFDQPFSNILVWILYIVITGGLHIDGLADTFDGIYSNKSRERMLEIMKDSQIGTFGTLGIISVLAAGIVSSSYLDQNAYFVFPIVSRSLVLIIANRYSYAREEGMGKVFLEKNGQSELATGVFFLTAVPFIFYGLIGVLAASLTGVICIWSVDNIDKKLKGITGDVIGFSIEFSQVAFLTLLYSLLKIANI